MLTDLYYSPIPLVNEDHQKLELIQAKDETNPLIENDMVVLDVDDDYYLTGSIDTQSYSRPAASAEIPMIITKDAQVERIPTGHVQLRSSTTLVEQYVVEQTPFTHHIAPLALGCGKLAVVFGALLVATYSLI
jgi:hypothetical protein